MGKEKTTPGKVSSYRTAMPLLESLYSEFKELSKKKPDGAVSTSKIRVANRLLKKVREVLENEESLEFLDLIEEDDVPQCSDITLMLSQYVAAMQGFKKKYYGYISSSAAHDWRVSD